MNGSIVGGYIYRGSAVPALRGRCLFGDYCSGEVFLLSEPDGEAAAAPFTVFRLVSFGEDAAGELYAVSISDSAVYRFDAVS